MSIILRRVGYSKCLSYLRGDKLAKSKNQTNIIVENIFVSKVEEERNEAVRKILVRMLVRDSLAGKGFVELKNKPENSPLQI